MDNTITEIKNTLKETKSDINHLKAELTNAQSGKVSLSRVPTGEYSKGSSTI